jgi:hypothetical protein
MKKALRTAYAKANIDPKADVYVPRAFWDVAQQRREAYGLDITAEMAAIYTLADFENRQIAHRMAEPNGPIVVFVPGTNQGHRLKDMFRELVSVRRGELIT